MCLYLAPLEVAILNLKVKDKIIRKFHLTCIENDLWPEMATSQRPEEWQKKKKDKGWGCDMTTNS